MITVTGNVGEKLHYITDSSPCTNTTTSNMRTRNQNKKNYVGKKSLKMQNLKDTDPKWSKNNAQMTFSTKNTNKWVNILASRYYNNINPDTNDIKWNDIFDKYEVDVVESQVNVSTSKEKSVSICIFSPQILLGYKGYP